MYELTHEMAGREMGIEEASEEIDESKGVCETFNIQRLSNSFCGEQGWTWAR